MTGRKHRQVRISNRSKANMLNDIYGSYYNNSLSNNNVASSKYERKAVALIEKFYGIDFNIEVLDSIIQSQLQDIRDAKRMRGSFVLPIRSTSETAFWELEVIRRC